jgi:hypothetical protein
VHVILTAQDMTKEALPMRDQFGLILCMRTQNPDTARKLNVRPAANIPDGRPGLAYSSTSGWVQCYYFDKANIAKELPSSTGGQTDDERKLFEAAMANRGRVTRGLIMQSLGVGEWDARRIQNELAQRNWLVKDKTAANAFSVTDRWKSVAGDGWRGLDGVGAVGGWSETKPESGLPRKPAGLEES